MDSARRDRGALQSELLFVNRPHDAVQMDGHFPAFLPDSLDREKTAPRCCWQLSPGSVSPPRDAARLFFSAATRKQALLFIVWAGREKAWGVLWGHGEREGEKEVKSVFRNVPGQA